MRFWIIFFWVAIAIWVVFLGLTYFWSPNIAVYYPKPELEFWNVRSVDTMRYSRDFSEEKLNDPSFDAVIDSQMKNIVSVGANYAAIATPYDVEFIPMLKRWVSAARKYNLQVWFRGNWSGWDGWFGYSKITRYDHIAKTKDFILANSDLFQDGDIFTACPECENGREGDPRKTGDILEYRKFLIDEYDAEKSAFAAINKKVLINYNSMNADVARLVMDKQTTMDLGGVVTVDHYVAVPEKLAEDLENIAAESGGAVVLGEFGAPLPGIHGNMLESEQAEWLRNSLNALSKVKSLIGVNYWQGVGGSTEIWDSKTGKARTAAGVLEQFYKPGTAYGVIYDELNKPVSGAKIVRSGLTVFSDEGGYFQLPYIKSGKSMLEISASGFINQKIQISSDGKQLNIVLIKEDKNLQFKILEFMKKIIESNFWVRPWKQG